MKLEFIQIIYDDEQRKHCYDFAKCYRNETLTPYFENDIIKNMVPEIQAEIIGVCSWRLAQKRGDMFRLIDKTLTVEKLTQNDYDVAVLTPRSPTHKPLLMASEWHHPAWTPAFEVFKRFLRTDLGIKVPNELSTAIYENHFVAKRDIYHDYTNNCLTPAIKHMDLCPDVYMVEGGYAKRKTSSERQRYFEITGRKDWPIAPFILERLFSIYCEGKGFKIISL